MTIAYALSIRQPWAALLVHGVKTIEVRTWPTQRRGRILIHAARLADDRRTGWRLVTKDMRETVHRRGGIIGAAELVDCVTYRDTEAFRADQERHRNEPDWFSPPCLFGFAFENMQRLDFREFPGSVRFFSVTGASRNA